MIQVHIVHEFAVRTRSGDRLSTHELHEHGERLMDALLDLEKCNEDITDAATSSEVGSGLVVAELVVTAVDEGAAVGKFMEVVRTAIHATGGVTRGWPAPAQAKVDYSPQSMQCEYV